MVLAKASRLGVRCHRLGTAAAGRHAACRVESCTGTGSGTAERTGCCPCYGSHSLQRMCWWPLFWPVRVKKQEKGKEWNDYKNNFTGKLAFPKWRVLNELTIMGFPWNVFTSSLKYLYACGETETRINKSVHDAAFQAECQEKCSSTSCCYLLSVRVRLECDVPVVVVCKLNTYHLWTVVVFEQWLNFL